MTRNIENTIQNDGSRRSMLENLSILQRRTAELEARLLAVTPPGEPPDWAEPAEDFPADENPAEADDAAQPSDGGGTRPADGRTAALINHGRRRARKSAGRRLVAHWRLVLTGVAVLAVAIIVMLAVLPGPGASWPASVAAVRTEITQACENPNVAAEPSQLNFACAKDTQQILWVFSLLTSGDNPGFVDQSTGRKGLEPIAPAQGGDIAWSLNLHHPYDPASALDSLEVAARAINNIISGATLTSPAGTPLVEPGLESKGANCQRYTGSAQLTTKQGFPAGCAAPISTPGEQAALVSDVFQQWMGGTPSQIANEAGVLFENAGTPGDPRVQAILASLPASGS
jgi:hypothetical protein